MSFKNIDLQIRCLIFCLFVGNSINSQAYFLSTPNVDIYTTCPGTDHSCCPTQQPGCGWVWLGETVQFKLDQINTSSFVFRIKKCNGTTFSTSGNFYIKTGGYCGDVLGSASVSAGSTSTAVTINIPANFNSGSLDFYGMYIAADGTRYRAGKIAIYYKKYLKLDDCLDPAITVTTGSSISELVQLQNIGTSTWSGTLKFLLYELNNPSNDQILHQSSQSIPAEGYSLFQHNSMQIDVSAGVYNLVVIYTNPPTGVSEDYVLAGSCTPTVTLNGITTEYRRITVEEPCSENANINITNPDPGDSYNSSIPITWTGSQLGTSCPVDIYYAIEVSGSPHLVVNNTSDDGSYNWNLSGLNINSNNVYIAVVYNEDASDGSEVGDLVGPFSIFTELNPPILVSPAQGIVFPAGTTSITYSWQKNNPNGAAVYDIKLRDLTTDQVILDYMQPMTDVSSFTHNYNYVENHQYRWLVRARNSAGQTNEPNIPIVFSIGCSGVPADIELGSAQIFSTGNGSTSTLYIGNTYTYSTTIINSGNTSWSGSLYLDIEGTPLIDLTFPNGVTIGVGQQQVITHNFVLAVAETGQNVPVEIKYQTNGQCSALPVLDGSFQNPVFVNILNNTGTPSISIITPPAGLLIGDNYNIQWSTINAPGCNQVTLEATISTLDTVALVQNYSFTGSSGTYNWNVGYDENSQLIPSVDLVPLKIKAYCTPTNTPVGYSNPFNLSGNGAGPCASFDDISPQGEIFEAAQCLCNLGYISPQDYNGDNVEDELNPDADIYRADLAKMVYFAIYQGDAESPADPFPIPFMDLYLEENANQIAYYKFSKALSYLEYGDGVTPFDRNRMQFEPYGTILKVDAIKVFLEAFNIAPDFSGPNPFPTYIQIGSPEYGYVKEAYDRGWITVGSDLYQPIPRKNAFIILHRMLSSCGDPCEASCLDPNPNYDDYFTPGNMSPHTLSRSIGMDEGYFTHRSEASYNIPGINLALIFAHWYNSYILELPSSLKRIIPLGQGWSHTYNCYLVKEEGWSEGDFILEDKIYVFWPGGNVNAYDANSLEPESYGVFDELIEVNANTFQIVKKNQLRYTFVKHTISLNNNVQEIFVLTEIKDRNNNKLQIVYENINSAPRIKKVIDTAGRELRFYYKSGTNFLMRVYDVAGSRNVYFNVDNQNNLKTYTNAKGNITQYGYGQQPVYHLLSQVTMPEGNTITAAYEGISRKLNSVNYPGNVFYNINVEPNYATPEDFFFSMIDSEGTVVSKELNELGQVKKVTSTVNNSIVEMEYAYNSPVDSTLPSNITYEGFGVNITYDDNGNVENIYLPDGINHRYTYTPWNDISTYRNPLGHTTRYFYTGQNLDRIEDNMGFETDVTIDSRGLVEQVTNPEGITYNFDYDNYGNQVAINGPLEISTTTDFDNIGRVEQITNPNDQVTAYEYDPLDLVKKMTSISTSGNIVTEYSYDLNANLKWIKNALGHKTNFSYTDLDQLETMEFGGDVKMYTYRDDGLLDSYEKPGGHVFEYEYDELGRLDSDGYVTYNYDHQDNIERIEKTGGQDLEFTYDVLNRMETVEYENKVVTYDYDNNSNVKKITYPDGFIVLYTYDPNDRLAEVKWSNKTITYDYLDDGRLSSVENENGTLCTYGYDAAGRMISMADVKSNGDTICGYVFDLDPLGNHIAEHKTEPFDDPVLTPVIKTGTYTNDNELISYAGVSYGFDDDGNQTSNGGVNATWDDRDLLLTYGTSSYVYDGMGLRRQRTKDGVTRKYVWDVQGMENILVESDAAGNALYYYVHGLGMCARVDANTQDVHYYHYDFRGSTIAMTDEDENITHQYSYLPYGSIAEQEEEDPNSFKFVGRYGVMDEGDSIYYMRARCYDSETGRFLSEDPVWNINLYSYVDNNVILSIDPAGKQLIEAAGLFAETFFNNLTNEWESNNGLTTIADLSLTVASNDFILDAVTGIRSVVNVVKDPFVHTCIDLIPYSDDTKNGLKSLYYFFTTPSFTVTEDDTEHRENLDVLRKKVVNKIIGWEYYD